MMNYLDLSQGKLAYDDTGGSGPLVIMTPGLGDLRQEYRFLVPGLVSAGYRAVTLDLRGHGDSSPVWNDYSAEAVGGDILALVKELGGGPATLIGTSYSAASAVWAAAERPDAVSAAVLIGPFVRDHPASFTQNMMMRAMFAGPWQVRAWGFYYNTLYPTRKPADFGAYRAALRANLAQKGRFDAAKAMIFASHAGVAARIPEVKVPTLVLMGTKDPDFPDPAAEARWIAEHVHGKHVMVEGAGHYPHAEMPEITAPIILEFLRENSKVESQLSSKAGETL